MSVRVMADVWEHSKAEGGKLLVLLALADWANDERKCWPRTETLARKARLSTRQLSRVLRELGDAGEIVLPEGPRSSERPYEIRQYVDWTPVADPDRTRMADSARAQETLLLEPPERTTTGTGQQTSLTPEPADELFTRWQRVFDRWDAKFTPARRKAALKALREEPGLEALEEAMRGFKAHRSRKPGGVELGDIFGTFRDTGDLRSRIEWARSMAAGTGTSAHLTEAAIKARVPSGGEGIVELRMERVEAMHKRPEDPEARRSGEESAELLRKGPPRIEPVIEDGRIAGWRDAT